MLGCQLTQLVIGENLEIFFFIGGISLDIVVLPITKSIAGVEKSAGDDSSAS